MALYTYSLHLLRESSLGPLLKDLAERGLVRLLPDNMLEILGFRFDYSSGDRIEGIDIVTLQAPDENAFEKFLAQRGNEFLEWLWASLREGKVLYGFIPGGGDFPYYENGVRTDELVWTQLSELFELGRVRIAHPLMLFASRLANGIPCSRARHPRESREGVGCIIGVTKSTEHGFEILEPGTMYPVFRKHWD